METQAGEKSMHERTSNIVKQKLPDIIEFCNSFKKYPSIHLYNLVRDLVLKSDSLDQPDDFHIIDAKESLNLADYVVIKHDKQANKTYLYVSFAFEQDLDLNWMHDVCVACEQQGMEVILCVHCIDGITYQTVEAGLPALDHNP